MISLDDMVWWSVTHIQMCGYFIYCYAAVFLHDGFNRCNTLWCHHSVCLTGPVQSVTELMPFMKSPVHRYTCCSDRHASPYWTFIGRWISLVFTPSLLKKTDDKKLFLCGAWYKRGRHLYTTTAPSCFIPASHCHLSATHQTISITAVSLQTIELCLEFLSHF